MRRDASRHVLASICELALSDDHRYVHLGLGTRLACNGDPIEMMHTKYGLLLKPVLLLQTALYGLPSRCSVFKALAG